MTARKIAIVACLALGLGLAARGLLADGPSEQVVAVTHVDVLPKFTAEGRELLRGYAAEARKLPGAVRVEILEEVARPNHATIVSTWASRAAFDDHLGAEAVRAFRGKLGPLLGSPFDERLHREVR